MKVKKRVPLGSLHKKWIDIMIYALFQSFWQPPNYEGCPMSYWKWGFLIENGWKWGMFQVATTSFRLQNAMQISCCKIEVLTRSIPQVVHLSVDSQVYVPPKIVSGMSWICCKNWGIQFRVLSILALLATPHPENELGESDLKTSLWQTSPTEAGFRSTKNQCE